MKTLTPGICASVLAFTLLSSAGCTDDDDIHATLTVRNNSDFVIEQLYLTDVNSSNWGPNLLSGAPLHPAEDFTLGVECGFYDARLVDEAGVECTLHDLDLCLNDATWLLTNNTCDAFSHAARERAAAGTQ
jgi:hypothetical protein